MGGSGCLESVRAEAERKNTTNQPTNQPNKQPNQVIYIAPLKALVRERMSDWGKGLCQVLGKKMVELTGEGWGDLKC